MDLMGGTEQNTTKQQVFVTIESKYDINACVFIITKSISQVL
jgi:hypothetical protein